jgi:hypothetical protein
MGSPSLLARSPGQDRWPSSGTPQGAKSHFHPGVDVWFSQDVNDKRETDIFGVRDGKILSGEVKTSASQFTSEQLTGDVDLSTRLEADIHVLTATSSIPDNVIDEAKQLCEASRLSLIVLSKSELLPGG